MDASSKHRSWRAATAIRAFALALATGLTLSRETLAESLPVLGGLALVATTCSTLSWGTWRRRLIAVPWLEAVAAAILLSVTYSDAALLVYLTVPPLVSGVRHGWVTTVNSSIVAGIAMLLALNLSPSALDMGRMAEALPWLFMGVGAGLLAAWQSRSVRALEELQAPYAASRHLMAQLRDLTRAGDVGLDTGALAQSMLVDLCESTGATRAAVFSLHPRRGHEQLATTGTFDFEGRLCLVLAGESLPPDTLALPLRSAEEQLGVVILVRSVVWSGPATTRAQAIADTFALRLDTAMLFEEVRLHATSEERNRLAREMHDGVAQEVVALGFLVDEIASESTEPEVQRLARSLRTEITRVVTELRLSIYDLRHELGQHLGGALAAYVRDSGVSDQVHVHLSMSEDGPTLPARMESEVLRVAQEAINNVRKHALATNLWVELECSGSALDLRISDDGVGNARPRSQHWGLDTMRERARAIGAKLDITSREGGGTVVHLSATTTADARGGTEDEHHRAAR